MVESPSPAAGGALATEAHLRALFHHLETRYGAPRRRRQPPLEELLLTVLSQNTTDRNRDRAWERLRDTFSSWEAVARAPARQIEEAIREAGLAGRKAATIQHVLRRLKRETGRLSLEHVAEMSDADALSYLTSFRGVGVKTAACVLCFSLGRAILPVDTHVHRLARRLGLVPPRAGREETHEHLNRVVPPNMRFPLHIHWIRHGRSVCTARSPDCSACVLRDLCPRVGV